jgi:hypothetical protein
VVPRYRTRISGTEPGAPHGGTYFSVLLLGGKAKETLAFVPNNLQSFRRHF